MRSEITWKCHDGEAISNLLTLYSTVTPQLSYIFACPLISRSFVSYSANPVRICLWITVTRDTTTTTTTNTRNIPWRSVSKTRGHLHSSQWLSFRSSTGGVIDLWNVGLNMLGLLHEPRPTDPPLRETGTAKRLSDGHHDRPLQRRPYPYLDAGAPRHIQLTICFCFRETIGLTQHFLSRRTNFFLRLHTMRTSFHFSVVFSASLILWTSPTILSIFFDICSMVSIMTSIPAVCWSLLAVQLVMGCIC